MLFLAGVISDSGEAAGGGSGTEQSVSCVQVQIRFCRGTEMLWFLLLSAYMKVIKSEGIRAGGRLPASFPNFLTGNTQRTARLTPHM